MNFKKCRWCKKEFNKKIHTSKKDWKKSKFCSRLCASKGKTHSHLKEYFFTKNTAGYWTGKKLTFDVWNKGKKCPQTTGNKNGMWKDNAGYGAIHNWIRRYKQKQNQCAECNKKGKTHWHNTNLKYKRNLEDWIELCNSCHRKLHYQIRKGNIWQ